MISTLLLVTALTPLVAANKDVRIVKLCLKGLLFSLLNSGEKVPSNHAIQSVALRPKYFALVSVYSCEADKLQHTWQAMPRPTAPFDGIEKRP